MDIPDNLKTALHEQLDKQMKIMRTFELPDAAKAISQRYRTESGQGKPLLSTDTEALAYAFSRMPATFGAVYTALRHTLASTGSSLETCLDAGAGTGAASWAADSLLDLQDICCMEREDVMLRLGRELMRAGSPALANARWILWDLREDTLRAEADLVIASYVCNEMEREERLKTVEKLWNAASQLLLLVEPGTPVCHAQLRDVRETMRGKGAFVAAPCPHERSCAIKGSDWCHFTVRIARSKTHRILKNGDAPFEDEKFTYLALSRTPVPYTEGRVLRHPFMGNGFVQMTVCTPEGIRECKVSKKDGELYKRARKIKCGELFPVEGCLPC